MNYTNEILIDLPVERVIELFDNPEHLKKWQPGLIRYEMIKGPIGKPGAQMRLVFQMGKRQVEMVETIKEKELPKSFLATYEAKGIYNFQKNRFEITGPNQTRWVSETEFKFSSLSMKVFAWLMPSAFKKESLKYMQKFKAFAEEQGLQQY